jgi:hypothetical protein
MNKLCSLILFLLSTTMMSYGQFATKGNFLIGGSSDFEFSSNTSKYKFGSASTVTSGRTTSFTLIPQVGYFITDHIAAGAGMTLSSTTYKPDGGGNKSTSSTFTFSPFGRYYFNKFYGQASFDVGTSHFNYGNGDSSSKNNISGWSLLGGYAINLSQMVTLEPQIGYASTTYKDNGDTKRYNSGLFIRAGIYIYLAKK